MAVEDVRGACAIGRAYHFTRRSHDQGRVGLSAVEGEDAGILGDEKVRLVGRAAVRVGVALAIRCLERIRRLKAVAVNRVHGAVDDDSLAVTYAKTAGTEIGQRGGVQQDWGGGRADVPQFQGCVGAGHEPVAEAVLVIGEGCVGEPCRGAQLFERRIGKDAETG